MDIKERTAATNAPISIPEEQQQSGAPRIVLLAIGDALVFIIFAVIGVPTHKVALTVPSVLKVAAPFALCRFAASPLVAPFPKRLTRQPRKMSSRSALAC